MPSYLRSPLIHTWLFLSLATVVSWLLGSDPGSASHAPHAALPVLVLLIAVVKCRIVMRNYMDVRFAPTWLQLTCDAWLALNFGMTSFFYWFVV